MGSIEQEVKPLANTALFSGVELGSLKLGHRLIMAPLTRMRASKESEGIFVPNDLMVEYYSQRATKGGFILTEATPISRLAAGYPGVAGIFTASQIAGWKKVTDAVHAKGGFIYCQLWHVGRATTPGLLGGQPAKSSTSTPISGGALDGTQYSDAPPVPMTVEEIAETVEEYAAAAKRALEAGFDGVEIHGANGYLLDQFLHDNVNDRTDEYGGSIEKRFRFPLEVIKSVTAAIGADKTGIRLSPFNYFQDTKDSDPTGNWSYICSQIAALPESNRVSYVHMVEPRFDEQLSEEEKLNSLPGETTASGKMVKSLAPFRKICQEGGIKFLAAGCFNRDNALSRMESEKYDGVVMGRLFISNPDLVRRVAEGLPLNAYDRSTFYGADPPSKGYTDYPFAQ